MDGDHSYLFDELTNDFQIGNDSEYIVETFRPVFEDDGSISGWNLVNPKDPNVTGNWISDDSGKKIGVKVEGFDYTGNYIAKEQDQCKVCFKHNELWRLCPRSGKRRLQERSFFPCSRNKSV